MFGRSKITPLRVQDALSEEELDTLARHYIKLAKSVYDNPPLNRKLIFRDESNNALIGYMFFDNHYSLSGRHVASMNKADSIHHENEYSLMFNIANTLDKEYGIRIAYKTGSKKDTVMGIVVVPEVSADFSIIPKESA